MAGEVPSAEERIADALERIAGALELIVSEDFQLNVGLSDVDAAATEAIAQVFAAVFQ